MTPDDAPTATPPVPHAGLLSVRAPRAWSSGCQGPSHRSRATERTAGMPPGAREVGG